MELNISENFTLPQLAAARYYADDEAKEKLNVLIDNRFNTPENRELLKKAVEHLEKKNLKNYNKWANDHYLLFNK